MKCLVLLALAFSVLTALADSMRPITTDDLRCTGKAKGHKSIVLTVQASPGKTMLTISEKGGRTREILNSKDLIVGSEGNVYIQQVSNELGYNLFMGGNDLWDVLNGQSRRVKVTGQFELFDPNIAYTLKCEGTLN